MGTTEYIIINTFHKMCLSEREEEEHFVLSFGDKEFGYKYRFSQLVGGAQQQSKYIIRDSFRHPTKYILPFHPTQHHQLRVSRHNHHHHHPPKSLGVRAKVRHVFLAKMIDGTVSNYV